MSEPHRVKVFGARAGWFRVYMNGKLIQAVGVHTEETK